MMNRAEFMTELERHLAGITIDEINDAMAYYNEYFDEAGPENEARVIEELISPARVAAQIKAESAFRGLDSKESPPPIKKGFSAIWFVLLGILALPLALPLVLGAFGVLVALIVAAFGVVISLVAVEVATFVAGFVSIVVGSFTIPVHLPTGLFYLGVGLLIVGFSLLVGVLVYLLTKGLVYFIAWVMNNILRKGRDKIQSTRMRGGRQYEQRG